MLSKLKEFSLSIKDLFRTEEVEPCSKCGHYCDCLSKECRCGCGCSTKK